MSSYVVKQTPGNVEWLMNDRFGMFIHFGAYSLAARHEWIKNYELIEEEKYDQYSKYFNPDLYDPREWARQAKEAGMKYAVLTTKHHEGFCLFDSKYTDYKSTNTPYGKDIVKEYVEAFRAEGLKVGLYYSLLDWHHPDFTIDRYHPRRKDPDAEQQSAKRDFSKYVEYMHNQVRELMTNYGKIDILWFDFSYTSEIEPWDGSIEPWMPQLGGKGKDDWKSEELVKMVRELQPGIIINDRLQIDQDTWTPEQTQPTQWRRHNETGELVPWEVCQTFSGSWGYYRDELTWKSPEMLIHLLINTVSYGGNLIMNVGPTARGYFDYRAEAALKVYGEWLKYNGRSIYGCTMAEPEFTAPEGTRLTQSNDESRLYVHLKEYPFGTLKMDNMYGKIDYVQFLHDASEVLYTENSEDGSVIFKLPVVKPNTIVPVLEIFLKS